MKITKIEKYIYRDKEYNELKHIETVIENSLGRIIDKMDVTLSPSQKLNILDILTGDKGFISSLLTDLEYLEELKEND